ncbi:1-(5-phosphoribosyl)-5-[(5-phosphoribosylamino) methylideneamino] imidazole-4-carboxamide isomerase [Bacteroidia bacterium]|nr:1-(5-phosphoribosyl)-5-[(5-phosphoribosylamino) methylideneamino] imidazole-4-carboxamide isomerase [Bacteroidia bacterium]
MIEIIPAIDIIDSGCVRLEQGDYDRRTSYGGDVVEMARSYLAAGVRRLHMVDLDGAKHSFPQNLATLERVASATGLDIEYGGGIKSVEALRSVFDAGASRAVCGSVAITAPEMFRAWLGEFGASRMILGADIRNGLVATHGWLRSSQTTLEQIIDMFAGDGLRQVICTDISKDGMLQGPSFELYDTLQRRYPQIDITVSGGIGSMGDIVRLEGLDLRSVIVGKALYEGRITLAEIKNYLAGGEKRRPNR